MKMDPRLYKELIENKQGMASDGSGLGHVSLATNPCSNASYVPAPMPTQGLTGAPPVPQVAPNFAPPPPFTSGSVLPHVSNSLARQ